MHIMMADGMAERVFKIHFQPLKCFLNLFVINGKGYPFKICCSSTDVLDTLKEARFECVK